MSKYQLKLDFGEGQQCHQAYETYIESYGVEDTEAEWVSFVNVWQAVEFQALTQSGAVLQ